MELAVRGAEVAAIQRPGRAPAARSTAPVGRNPPKPSKAEREQARRAEARAERLHLVGLTNPG